MGGPGELAELRALAAGGGGEDWLWADEVTDGSLHDFAALVSLATLFMGHDSGPLHVAGAYGVPVVGVFTPGTPERTWPQGTGGWRMLTRSSPAGVRAGDLLALVDDLLTPTIAAP